MVRLLSGKVPPPWPKYATITIFKGICQFILMAAIKVNYSRRQNVQKPRSWRQEGDEEGKWGKSGKAENRRQLGAPASFSRYWQRPIRHNTLDLAGCRCSTAKTLRPPSSPLHFPFSIYPYQPHSPTTTPTDFPWPVFNFPNDIIAVDPIRIWLRQMTQNEYLVSRRVRV